MRPSPHLLLLCAATALAACSLIVDTRGRCDGDADCLGAERCDDGFCVPTDDQAPPREPPGVPC